MPSLKITLLPQNKPRSLKPPSVRSGLDELSSWGPDRNRPVAAVADSHRLPRGADLLRSAAAGSGGGNQIKVRTRDAQAVTPVTQSIGARTCRLGAGHWSVERASRAGWWPGTGGVGHAMREAVLDEARSASAAVARRRDAVQGTPGALRAAAVELIHSYSLVPTTCPAGHDVCGGEATCTFIRPGPRAPCRTPCSACFEWGADDETIPAAPRRRCPLLPWPRPECMSAARRSTWPRGPVLVEEQLDTAPAQYLRAAAGIVMMLQRRATTAAGRAALADYARRWDGVPVFDDILSVTAIRRRGADAAGCAQYNPPMSP